MAPFGSFKNVRRGLLVACSMGMFSRAVAEAPLWVIEDADSTIYLFGTVHLLKPDQGWLTETVESALTRADEVWFELPLQEDLAAMQAQVAPIFMQAALSPDQPMSARLNAGERQQLVAAIARTNHPEQMAMAIEHMKPWFAVVQLAKGPLQASGYDSEYGMDVVLARLARQKGKPVHGLETFEQQFGYLSQGTDSEQLDALRGWLNRSDATNRLESKVAEMAFRRWIDGDPELMGLLMSVWSERPYPESAPVSYAVMVKDRNVRWAEQIADCLSGNGVTFIAVGAGHLVGPDNVRELLAARGIRIRKL
jgi:uncharacterized protein YbaP (TraB family)